MDNANPMACFDETAAFKRKLGFDCGLKRENLDFIHRHRLPGDTDNGNNAGRRQNGCPLKRVEPAEDVSGK